MREDTQVPSSVADRYQIQRELGRGGMATVYLARDTRNERAVAVKILQPDLCHTLGLERFQREIAITANFTHPNILPLHDAGEADGRFYYVMPYIEGESLRDRLRRERQLPIRDALSIARGLSSALEHAHAHGVVHRDIKPENVLLSNGHPLLSDFGIARVLAAESERLTATGLSLGTPGYMSPEQGAGESDVDARSDIYSLGCVLYEMLAGEPPFTGVTAQAVLVKRLTTPALDIRSLRDNVPDSVAEALAQTLARVPADRIQTMAALRAILEQAELECANLSSASGARSTVRLRSARTRRRAVSLGAIALVVSALLGGALWMYGGPPRGSDIRTLAVLPLSSVATAMGSMGGDIFADGLTEAIINGLSQLGSVNVISRTSVMQYQMVKKSLREIGRELNADAVLEGAVTRSGDRVRITARLVRASDEGDLWTGSYERQLGDALALQSDIAEAVAEEIGVRLLPEHSERPRAVKPASQQAYAKGTYFAGQWRLEEAIQEFQHAVEIDPGHSTAYASLARAFYFRAFFGEVAPAEAFSQMRRAAERALERDERSAEAHGLMALVATHYDWDWKTAEEHFRRALALSPSSAQVHHDYAHFLLAAGRQQESVAETKRALELDPANPMLTSCVGWHSLFDKRFDEAERYAVEAQRMMPSYWAQVVKGWAFIGKHQNDSALAAMRMADSLSAGLSFTRAGLAHALAHAGRAREARQILGDLLERALKGYVSAYDIAIVFAGLGDSDHAIQWLEKAMGERSMFVVHLSWDMRLDGLRSDPRFVQLAKRLGVPVPAPGLPVA